MSDPIALVTGAGQGTGRATAERFARGGYRVVAGVRDLDRAHEEYGDQPGITLVRLDVTQPDDIAAAVAVATDLAGGGAIDVLVNNAGYAMMATQEDGDLEQARRMFDVNLWGAAAMVQAVVPAMREARRGTVVAVSSIGARITWPLIGFYHASKYALSSLTQALAFELAPFGVRVAMIEPGMITTRFSGATVRSGAVTDEQSEYAPLASGLRSAFGTWRERDDTSSAEDCAEVIWSIVQDDDPPLCQVVGGDAVEIDGIVLSTPDADELQDRIRGFLAIHDWSPAPPAPRP